MDRYPRVVEAVRRQPWAILPEVLASFCATLAARNAGARLTQDEIAALVGARREDASDRLCAADGGVLSRLDHAQPLAAATGGRGRGSLVAVLGVYGVITQRADLFTGTSTERVSRRLAEATQDPAVSGVVLDIDSPGGGVFGLEELARSIFAARKAKPVEAVSNSMNASAAYWLASQAERVTGNATSQTGSIGVYMAHVDLSAMYEALGQKWTMISYGENKVLGNEFEPLSDEARTDIEKKVKEYGHMFEAAVSRGRGVPASQVRERFGAGLTFGAAEAVERGLLDGVGTLDDAVRRVARGRKSASASAEREAALVRARIS